LAFSPSGHAIPSRNSKSSTHPSYQKERILVRKIEEKKPAGVLTFLEKLKWVNGFWVACGFVGSEQHRD